MSTEILTMISVGVALAGLILALSRVLSRRMDRLGTQIARLDSRQTEMRDHMDTQGAELRNRIEAQGANLGERIDAQGAEQGGRLARLEGRLDTLLDILVHNRVA